MAGVNEQPLQLGGGEFGVSTFGEEFQDESGRRHYVALVSDNYTSAHGVALNRAYS